ncbi:hypothetical protein ACF0H5_002297 [Mactra antiquata]
MTAHHVEIPGVNAAVEHLNDLADRMKHDFGFGDNDVINIDLVIEALKELEILRYEVHDRLEAETIKASIKRHRLQFLPDQIKKELADAISSAQKSNADVILELKQQLRDINKNIVYLEDYQKKLDAENAQLHPEREQVRQQHEEIISQLNQRMAEKASMQIQLNETRDKVRQTNQEIVDLEDGILQLKEDLIQERGEARTVKRQLKKAVATTSEETKKLTLVNVDKKKDLDVLHEQLMDSEGKLDALNKSVRRYETSKAKLEGQERALTAQLQKQLYQNEELRKKGKAIVADDSKTEKEFIENEAQLTNKLKRLEREIESEENRYYELDIDRENLGEELEELMQIRQEDAERVSELDNKLQLEKRNLSSKAEEVGDMQAQNTKMLEDIETLGETHKAVLAQLNKQIEEYREQLAKERKERLEVQQRKNSVSKELEDFKLENQRYMQQMNNTITQGKQEHIDLSNEGAQLQRELKTDDREIQDLEDQLDVVQKQYEESFNKRQNEVDKMEREVLEMENNIADKSQTIEDKTPGFEELEKFFEERTAAYEKQKKDIVELKGKKSHLEEQIKRLKDKKERMVGPQEKLRNDLKHKRKEVMFQLKHHGEETKNIEAEIYVGGCKLKTVLDENNKIQEGCDQLSADIDDIQYQMEYNEKLKAQLMEELHRTKVILEKTWEEDNETQEKFSERDQEVVDDLGILLDKTGKREEKISNITSQLEIELGYLTSFLDNLASRRPKDSYLSQCRTPTPDSRGRSTPSSLDGRLSQISARSQNLRDLVAEANRAESRKSSRPATSKSVRSAKSVVIAEEVTEFHTNKKNTTKSLTKL